MSFDARDVRSGRAAWLLPLSLVALGGVAWACQGAGDDGLGDDAAVRRVLESVSSRVLAPATADFSATAADLQAAVATHAADPTDPDALAAAQGAWRDAMLTWQRLEVMQIGPAGSSLSVAGGEDIRDSIYSWPTADSCAVDRALAEGKYSGGDFFTAELVWSYGLDALEYLLFSHEAEHSCAAQVQLDGPWGALTFEELEQRRADYAQVLANAIAERAATLATRWSDEGYGERLTKPGEGDSPYGSAHEALDDVFRAMFYVDLMVKDDKLGIPLGFVEGCPEVPCLGLMETPYSGEGAATIVANLEALRVMVQGGPDRGTADGFDDLLADAGEGAIADKLFEQIDTAIARAEEVEGSLQDAAANGPNELLPLHTAVKNVTDTLKGPFRMALMLSIPAEGAGDAD